MLFSQDYVDYLVRDHDDSGGLLTLQVALCILRGENLLLYLLLTEVCCEVHGKAYLTIE